MISMLRTPKGRNSNGRDVKLTFDERQGLVTPCPPHDDIHVSHSERLDPIDFRGQWSRSQ